MSWAPTKAVKKGTYTATVTWKIGSLATSSAKTTFKVTEYPRPQRMMRGLGSTTGIAVLARAAD